MWRNTRLRNSGTPRSESNPAPSPHCSGSLSTQSHTERRERPKRTLRFALGRGPGKDGCLVGAQPQALPHADRRLVEASRKVRQVRKGILETNLRGLRELGVRKTTPASPELHGAGNPKTNPVPARRTTRPRCEAGKSASPAAPCGSVFNLPAQVRCRPLLPRTPREAYAFFASRAKENAPLAASTLSVSPSRNSPATMVRAMSVSRSFWISRLSGRAPKTGS